MQNWQREGGGFAGARLRASQNITPSEGNGDRLLLNGCRNRVSSCRYGTLELRIKIKFCKLHITIWSGRSQMV